MEDSLNKPIFKPKFKSEFSMGELDFKRFDKWLDKADETSGYINSCIVPELELVQAYFSQLNVLYKSWRALISSVSIKNELDESIKEAKRMKRVWEESNNVGNPINNAYILSLVDLLDSIHTKLLDIKQVIGLGIVVKKMFTTKEKIKYGIRPRTNYSDLPEA